MLEEFQGYLDTIKDNQEEFSKVQSALSSYIPPKEANITLDKVKGLFDTDASFKSFLDSEKDKHSGKALETWKQNNLNKLIEEELKKRDPKSPEDQKFAELTQKIQEMEKSNFQKEMLLKLKDTATEKKLPSSLVHLFVGSDEDETFKNFEVFENAWNEALSKTVEGVYKKEGYTPPSSSNSKIYTQEEIAKMTQKEINENWEAIIKSQSK